MREPLRVLRGRHDPTEIFDVAAKLRVARGDALFQQRLALAGARVLKRARILALALGVAPIACALLICLLLAGCATPAPPAIVETRVQVQRVTLPPGLLGCQPEPALGAWTLQSQVADYIVRLHEAWADCHDTVHAIAQIENAPPAAPTAMEEK